MHTSLVNFISSFFALSTFFSLQTLTPPPFSQPLSLSLSLSHHFLPLFFFSSLFPLSLLQPFFCLSFAPAVFYFVFTGRLFTNVLVLFSEQTTKKIEYILKT